MNLDSFLKLCNYIGNNYELVQGTGGNVSLKLNKEEMLIKASGMKISDIKFREVFLHFLVTFTKLISNLPHSLR